MLLLQGARVQFLARALRAQMLHGVAKKKKSYTVSGVPKTLPRWKIHPWLRFIYSDILRLHSWILFPSIIEKGVTCVQCSCSREPTGNPASKVLLEGMRGMVIMYPLTVWWEKISLHGGKKSQTPRWTAGVQHKPHCSHKPMRHTKLRLLDGEGWVQHQIQVPRGRQAFRKIVNSGLLC